MRLLRATGTAGRAFGPSPSRETDQRDRGQGTKHVTECHSSSKEFLESSAKFLKALWSVAHASGPDRRRTIIPSQTLTGQGGWLESGVIPDAFIRGDARPRTWAARRRILEK